MKFRQQLKLQHKSIAETYTHWVGKRKACTSKLVTERRISFIAVTIVR